MPSGWRRALLGCLLVTAAVCCFDNARLAAQQPAGAPSAKPVEEADLPPGIPVYFRGREVARVYQGAGPFTAEERARAAEARLNREIFELGLRAEEVRVTHDDGVSRVIGAGRVLAVIDDRDAAAAGQDRKAMAERYAAVLRSLIVETRAEFEPRAELMAVGLALGATAIAALILMLAFRASRRALDAIRTRRLSRVAGVDLASSEMAGRVPELAAGAVRVARAVVLTAIVLAWLERVMSLLPWTRPYANRVTLYLSAPIASLWDSFLRQLPNLAFLIAIAVITYAAMSAIRLLFREIDRGTIKLESFPAEWATPTYNIVRVLLVALAFVAAFPYIPGSKSPAFQGVSLFLGLLVSLSSSSAIANVIAGTILTYTNAFRVGDRVAIGEAEGDVLRTTLLVTQVQTIKNVVVSIPNGVVLGSQIVNYSRLARTAGLILHTEVTIGYDSPWRTVHALLIQAANATRGIIKDPPPFVLQRGLNDFYVTYELNAFTRQPAEMVDTYSRLCEAIQDSFAAGGVEIMSPHYASLRDGRASTIPRSSSGSSDAKAD